MKYYSIFSICCYIFFFTNTSVADPLSVTIGDGRIHKTVKSYHQLKTENIVMQQQDYSCGAASLATLMRYYFSDDVTELDLLDTARSVIKVDEKQLQQKGLSLLDLKKIAEHHGYRAQGFKLTINQLNQIKGPVIIFFKPFGYEHFAVLKGVKGDRVFIADPSRGHYRDAIYRFEEEWDGIVLALDKNLTLQEDSPLLLDDTGMTIPERLSIQRMMQAGSIANKQISN